MEDKGFFLFLSETKNYKGHKIAYTLNTPVELTFHFGRFQCYLIKVLKKKM